MRTTRWKLEGWRTLELMNSSRTMEDQRQQFEEDDEFKPKYFYPGKFGGDGSWKAHPANSVASSEDDCVILYSVVGHGAVLRAKVKAEGDIITSSMRRQGSGGHSRVPVNE
ncbi:hypothetical protein V9T40_004176 [Parthenolecanium corni]|uniref:Uncharacterized protein n=1 Tax=Parthenolecanium corni TaxID=536013 RepID=A0AAN9Y8D3_9HEMI